MEQRRVGTFAAGDTGPQRILAGGIHYFRIAPGDWRPALRRLRAMGLNSVDTYIPWNLHEMRKGEFDFSGIRDFAEFVRLAAEEGMYAILRPGPYICSEWDNGAIPAWLRQDRTTLRTAAPVFMDAVYRWYDEVIPRIASLQSTRGGSVIALQVDNDFGRQGTDPEYYPLLRDAVRERGIDVTVYTIETPGYLHNLGTAQSADGMVPTIWTEAESHVDIASFRERWPNHPLFVSEFVCGPIQHWGEPHLVHDPDYDAQQLETILASGADVSLYMAHGGTNFGLWNGANASGDDYRPAVTSYDYDAPISEHGELTRKFWTFREVLGRYHDLPDVPEDLLTPRTLPTQTAVPMSPAGSLLGSAEAVASQRTTTLWPPTFEDLGQTTGFVLHRRVLPEADRSRDLVLHGVADRALVFADGVLLGAVERGGPGRVTIPGGGTAPLTVEILVENLGRVNFGPSLGDRKGIVGGVQLDDAWLQEWETFGLELSETIDLGALSNPSASHASGPAFYVGTFDLAESGVTAFLRTPGWQKGIAWINGFCLGRYWSVGPQLTLYVPPSVARQGSNEIVLLELHPTDIPGDPEVVLVGSPDLGSSVPWQPPQR